MVLGFESLPGSQQGRPRRPKKSPKGRFFDKITKIDMIFNIRHPHFFGSKEVNFLYLTLGLSYFGKGLIAIFIPIYFWELGFPFWKILFFYFLISLFFVLLAFFIIPLLRKTSDEMMLFLSIPFLIVYYLGLSLIINVPFIFYILPFLMATHMLFFNIGYHLNFTGAVNGEYIGRELGARNVTGKLFRFSAPFIGGLVIGFLGFQINFIIGSIVLFLAVLPLFFVSKRKFPAKLNSHSALSLLKDKNLRFFNIVALGYGAETMVSRIVWPLFIFLAIGSIQVFGGIISLGIFVSATVAYFAGFLSDTGRRRKVLAFSTSVISIIWATRPFLVNPFLIVGSHIGGHIFNSSLMVALGSQHCKIARFVSAPGVFIFIQEVLYNGARIIFLPILILLSLAFPIEQFFKISFILAAAFTLLYLFANKLYLKDLKKL